MLHLPLIKAILAAVIPYSLFVYFQSFFAEVVIFEFSMKYFFYAVAGLLYVHFFEYFWHYGPMHNYKKFTETFKRHQEHHKIFVKNNFQNRNPDDLQNITTSTHIFPLLLSLHYPVFCLLSLISLVDIRYAPSLFLFVTLHFLTYEIGHWFTHVKNNFFDNFITSLPLMGSIRYAQIEHHRLHHHNVQFNYSFTPPYLPDWLRYTKK